jgi:hypothetical protein
MVLRPRAVALTPPGRAVKLRMSINPGLGVPAGTGEVRLRGLGQCRDEAYGFHQGFDSVRIHQGL